MILFLITDPVLLEVPVKDAPSAGFVCYECLG